MNYAAANMGAIAPHCGGWVGGGGGALLNRDEAGGGRRDVKKAN